MPKLTIVGTTTWGITVALLLSRRGTNACIWARTEREANALRSNGPDPTRFPGVTFPKEITVTSHIEEAMDGSKAVLLAVPSQTMRQNIRLLKNNLIKSSAEIF